MMKSGVTRLWWWRRKKQQGKKAVGELVPLDVRTWYAHETRENEETEQRTEEVAIDRDWPYQEPYVVKGVLRSGQLIQHRGDVVVIGHVHPGAKIVASGDVYVFGDLKGYVHAGAAGNRDAVVAASYFEPVQVQIAEEIQCRAVNRNEPAEMYMARLVNGQMEFVKMTSRSKLGVEGVQMVREPQEPQLTPKEQINEDDHEQHEQTEGEE